MSKICSRCNQSSTTIKRTDNWSSDHRIIPLLDLLYFEYLCKTCFNELESKILKLGSLDLPKSLVENEHYYIENGKWVFTEKYHFLKGYCCNNGCRHCPYGFKSNNEE